MGAAAGGTSRGHPGDGRSRRWPLPVRSLADGRRARPSHERRSGRCDGRPCGRPRDRRGRARTAGGPTRRRASARPRVRRRWVGDGRRGRAARNAADPSSDPPVRPAGHAPPASVRGRTAIRRRTGRPERPVREHGASEDFPGSPAPPLREAHDRRRHRAEVLGPAVLAHRPLRPTVLPRRRRPRRTLVGLVGIARRRRAGDPPAGPAAFPPAAPAGPDRPPPDARPSRRGPSPVGAPVDRTAAASVTAPQPHRHRHRPRKATAASAPSPRRPAGHRAAAPAGTPPTDAATAGAAPPPATATRGCSSRIRRRSASSSGEKSLTVAAGRSVRRSAASSGTRRRTRTLIAPPAAAWRSSVPSTSTSGSVRTVRRSRS